MSSSPAEKTSSSSRKVYEGIFAVDKPQWSSSAGVLRDLQDHFARSNLFAPWLESEKRKLFLAGAKPKHQNNLKVKLGHGGTLDPMATGVLIVGVGRGTKCLQRFLECTKTYECVVLFGAATDSYDAVGKVVSKAPYAHVTQDLVEKKLAQFRGKIMQKPSVFSALKVDGKKLYEYAREGKDIPEVAARPVEVKSIELVEWLAPGSHDFAWPTEEADATEKEGAEKLLGIRKEDAQVYTDNATRKSRKRSRTPEDDHVNGAGEQPKKPRTEDEPAMSGALPANDDADMDTATVDPETTEMAAASTTSAPQPPAARLQMTVTSGFYVRSLCHDLGLACSSLGLMSSLVRSRQGAYALSSHVAPPQTSAPSVTDPSTEDTTASPTNDASTHIKPPATTTFQPVLSFTDLAAGPSTWEPFLQAQLTSFMSEEGWDVEEVEDEEIWQAKKKEHMENRKEGDRDRSYRGGGNKWGGGKSKWQGKGRGGGGRGYSKNMDGGEKRGD